MDDNQQLTLWIGALRYYIGRKTYAVSDFCELLIQEWHNLPEKTRLLIQRDLEEAFVEDDRLRAEGDRTVLGMDCDRAEWEKVRKSWQRKWVLRLDKLPEENIVVEGNYGDDVPIRMLFRDSAWVEFPIPFRIAPPESWRSLPTAKTETTGDNENA